MFILAGFFIVYGYLIFFLGITSLLTKANILIVTIVWIILLGFILRKRIRSALIILLTKKVSFITIRKNKLLTLMVSLFALQAMINLIGALGPELAFDALWYHLTLPKLYLIHHSIYHIPGGLLYYSDMPKLGELFYVGVMAFGNEITAKLLHFFFGLLICLVLYKIGRKYLSPFLSFLAVVIFYSNLVVAWESTTAYIDLIRTFFEVMSLWGFLLWLQSTKRKWLLISAIMLGGAIMTKLLAIGTGLIVSFLIIYKIVFDLKKPRLLFELFLYLIIALAIPLPWFMFSYLHTGNPVYPFFSHVYEVTPEPLTLISFFRNIWTLFTHAADPISPIYLIMIPLLFIVWKNLRMEMKYLTFFSSLAIIIWYFTPRTGGGRFILPYLPVFSLLCVAVYSHILKNMRMKTSYLSKMLMVTIIFIAIVSIIYRGVATMKYIPVVFGIESEQAFLTNHLNFAFGDFYDTDTYYARKIQSDDRVLLYGFHNLYYVDFPFIDNSWIQKGDTFDYVAAQNSTLPVRFQNWHLIYKNDKTLVELYAPPKGQCHRTCVY